MLEPIHFTISISPDFQFACLAAVLINAIGWFVLRPLNILWNQWKNEHQD